MSKTVTFGLVATVALLAAAPGFAGPIGSGLGFTEEVSKRRAAERTVKIVRAEHPCVQRAAATLETHADVTSVKAHTDGLLVTFRSGEKAAQHEADVRTVVNDACAAA